ncbi:hypothetical protein HKK74_32810 [Actinomadura alba]|uniref:Aconitase A/isopropylmalate dehydratase small subunit swivel domain-containing protein n=1 Tax=Actinomadura alba TaxID=406431 RepID=A0ABR7LZE7_9ACTN|nr:hypothetical protein [Actinomadura alba]
MNIYSNTDQENWAPIFRDFQKKYPWVKKISANNLDKGPTLLGVRAILAVGFERIHRSNLVGMGVLPLQFLPGQDADTLGLTGEETYAIHGLTTINNRELPDTLTIEANTLTFEARVRLDTPREIDYYRHGGIMPYVLRGLLPSPERLRPRIH